MAASANPPAGNNSGQEGTGNGNGATTNGLSVPENSVVGPTQAALRHNPGLSVDWTPDEQSLLEELLAKYATESNISRYAKIAMQLKDKTVRDVALRCRWMSLSFRLILYKTTSSGWVKFKNDIDQKAKVEDTFGLLSNYIWNPG